MDPPIPYQRALWWRNSLVREILVLRGTQSAVVFDASTCVDLRQGLRKRGLDQLQWGITGKKD